MLGQIREKMAIQELALGEGDKFFAFNLTVVANSTSACNDLCTLGGDCSTVVGNGS